MILPLSFRVHLGAAPLGFTQGPLLGPRVNPEFRAVLPATENVSAHNVRACTWRACVHGVRACARHACVCLPASRYVSVSYGLSDSLHTACVRACTGHACVHTACVRSHCVHSCVRAHGVRTCVHTECDAVRAFTRRACVRAFTRRACVRAHCLRAHGVDACIHPARSPWCTGHWLQRHHRMACARAHDVRACTRCACVHTACFRAHGAAACTRRSLVYPSSAVSIVCRSLLQRHYRRRLLRCCHCPCVQLCWGLHRVLVGPPCKP
jgi:hypothetical protein